MNIIQVIIALGLAPGIFWLWFFYKKDKWEPEPSGLVINTFLWGAVATIPAMVIELPFSGSTILTAVIIAPIVEEICKFITVKHTIFAHAEFDEPMDGIVYGTAAALGFASAENVLYLLAVYFSPELFDIDATPTTAIFQTFIMRSILSVPGHALWGAIWGFALAWTKFGQPNSLAYRGLWLAIVLHGLFNFLASIKLFFALGMLILVPLMWKMVNQRIVTALSASPHQSHSLEQ